MLKEMWLEMFEDMGWLAAIPFVLLLIPYAVVMLGMWCKE